MLDYLWVAFGGALGSVARFWAAGFVSRYAGDAFPWGTLAVNITGSFLIGLFATLTAPDGRWTMSPSFRTFFMVGICGGYTTFSAFSLQTLNLIRSGAWLQAGLNSVLSVVLCLLAVGLGCLLANALRSSPGGL
ncbi:MAG: fluoride efflux transporter CrcB [Verrucomicrobia bacterium]|nr:fluoride efflux transporter CrcB [Verrucomicrobiota bacterium]MBI3870405.1 fluoride efflux transporter CrcB [Verrucomicrobiota bacterium]